MASSSATDVARYIEEQPEGWQAALRRLRAACREHLSGYEEVMAHGMPSYRRDDETEAEVAFAKQQQYLSFYVLKQPVLDAHRAELDGLDVGKGCIRYRKVDQIDWGVVAGLLRDTASSDADVC
jgi:uncharacterized protein YdhG (YjbR/CyaY superfamily)